MLRISTYLDDKPYQVAVSIDRTLLRRKWNHLGTVPAPTAKSAAYAIATERGIPGDAVATHGPPVVGHPRPPQGESGQGTVYEFAGGHFILVSFGS